MSRPNLLFIMTDQQRFDTIAALGHSTIRTPNLDRLVRRGVAFTNAYSTCPVCVPARYTIRSGREPIATGVFTNGCVGAPVTWAQTMEDRCGPFLARCLGQRGYRTFGIGKFHSHPWDQDLGFDVQLHSEELYENPRQRAGDAFARFIREEHPGYDWIDSLQGERTEMYYIPQMSPLPAALTVESWAADRAVEQIRATDDSRPFFGHLSFIGPHPPFAPPQPFNRLYDPDGMPNPIRGELAVDHADDYIPWMNHAVWAEDIGDSRARILKARYYGEITYIDQCLGRVVDAVEARPDSDNTVICFFSDHGDMLGDHHGWQKECFFEASCHVPLLVSWPARLPAGARRGELACLTDLFGLATTAAGVQELRDGIDLLGLLEGRVAPREILFGCYGRPGGPAFKVMACSGGWKYIYIANGGREQLFNTAADPHERVELSEREGARLQKLRAACIEWLSQSPIGREALVHGGLWSQEFAIQPRCRILQFDLARGIKGFGQPALATDQVAGPPGKWDGTKTKETGR